MGFPERGERIPPGETSMKYSRTTGHLVRPEGKGQGRKWGQLRQEKQGPRGPWGPGTELTEVTRGFEGILARSSRIRFAF